MLQPNVGYFGALVSKHREVAYTFRRISQSTSLQRDNAAWDLQAGEAANAIMAGRHVVMRIVDTQKLAGRLVARHR